MSSRNRLPSRSSLLSIQDHLFRAYASLERKRHRLLYLFFELTNACNLNCLHCGSDCDRESRGLTLSTDSWIHVIEYIASEYPDVTVVLTGGEPLVYSDLLRITDALYRHGVRWGMVTNGILLTNERMRTFVEHGIRSMTISLDGPREVHDWLRNRDGAFDSAVQALGIAAGCAMPHADVVTCVTPRVLERLDETSQIISATGIREWRLFRIFPAGRASNNHELLLNKDQTGQLLSWISRRRSDPSCDPISVSYACEGWVPQRFNRRIRNPLSMCRAGINIASILADGTMTGCPNNDSRFHIGNIAERSIRELWEHGFDDFRDRDWLVDTSCNTCRFARFCRGSSMHLWRSGKSDIDFCYVENTHR